MTDKGWAHFFARVILFFMAGFWKTFELTPMQHAQGSFVEAYAETWIPAFLLWALGLAIPVVELVAGALLIVGWRTRDALVTIGFILLIVTYGHTLAEPLYSIQGHILPRGLLMFIALVLPSEKDKLSIDAWLSQKG